MAAQELTECRNMDDFEFERRLRQWMDIEGGERWLTCTSRNAIPHPLHKSQAFKGLAPCLATLLLSLGLI